MLSLLGATAYAVMKADVSSHGGRELDRAFRGFLEGACILSWTDRCLSF